MFQSTLETLSCYGHMIDSTILTAINDLSIMKTNATTKSKRRLNTLLDYLHANANAIMLHQKSDMTIKVHSDASCLSMQGARSRSAGHMYRGNDTPMHKEEPHQGEIYQ